jgi:hypothetical protein
LEKRRIKAIEKANTERKETLEASALSVPLASAFGFLGITPYAPSKIEVVLTSSNSSLTEEDSYVYERNESSKFF